MRANIVLTVIFAEFSFLIISCVHYGSHLHAAIRAGNAEAVAKLIKPKRTGWLKRSKSKPDVEVRDTEGLGPLMSAVSLGRADIVEILLNAGADVDVEDSERNTCAHYAAAVSFPESEKIIASLTSHGARLSAVNESYETPLRMAVNNDMEVNVRALIRIGANVEDRDAYSNTILHCAARVPNENIAAALLDAGANMEARNMWCETPLMIAVSSANERVVRLLLRRGADINASEHRMKTCLHRAVSEYDERNLRFIASLGINLNCKNKWGETALLSAMKYGYDDFVRILVEAGADVEARDVSLNTPLHYFRNCKDDSTLDLFLSKGPDLNFKNTWHKTAFESGEDRVFRNLHFQPDDSVKNGFRDNIYVLVEGGCDVTFPEIHLEYFSWFSYKLWKDKIPFENFDHFILHMTNAYFESRKFDEHHRDLHHVMRKYRQLKVFALYRILKALYPRSDRKPSLLENAKYDIFDRVLTAVVKKTYMERLPLEIVSDAFYYSGYYAWKSERFSWYLALASCYTDVNVTENIITKLLPNNIYL